MNELTNVLTMKIPLQPAEERISLRQIAAHILEVLNLERGLGYTVKKMLADPYGAIREYLFENRRRMVRPITLLLLVVGITTYLSFRYFPMDQQFVDEAEMKQLPSAIRPAIALILQWVRQYYNLFLMSSLPFAALATYLLFRSDGLNYAEHLIINIYVYSIQTLLLLLFIPLIVAYPKIFGPMIGLISTGYAVYAFTRIFEQTWKKGLLKTVLVYVLSQTFIGIVISVLVAAIWVASII